MAKIEKDKIYRHKYSNIGYAKAIEILLPKTTANPHGYKLVKCLWSTDKNFNFALIKHFRLHDLTPEKQRTNP